MPRCRRGYQRSKGPSEILFSMCLLSKSVMLTSDNLKFRCQGEHVGVFLLGTNYVFMISKSRCQDHWKIMVESEWKK